MKTQLSLASFVAILLMPFVLLAQYPAPLNEANFPKVNDSIRVLKYTIPATQSFPDDNPANDTLSIDRTLEKAIQSNNSLDQMSNIAIGGFRNDTITMFFYMGFAEPEQKRIYNAWSPFYPGASSFTTANLHTIIPTSQGDAHTYYKRDATGFYELGFFVNTPQGAMTSVNNPPRPIAMFPVDFASPNNVSNLTIVSNIAGPGMTITSNTTMSITIDAYGDLTIIDGTIMNPIYTTHTGFLRLCTFSEDNMDLGSGMNIYLTSKIYTYYISSRFEPVATYSVAQIRSNIPSMYWSMGGKWEDKIGVSYTIPYSTVSINEVESNYFNIFPNPTDGQVIINFENMKEEQIYVDIYDISGKLMGSYSKFADAVEFDLSSYPSGKYIVHLRINDRVFPSKIIRK